MSEVHPRVAARSDGPAAPEPRAPKRECVTRAIQIGGHMNAFRWWWRQAFLTRDQRCWDEARRARAGAADLLRETDPTSAGASVLDSFEELLWRELSGPGSGLSARFADLVVHVLRSQPLPPDLIRGIISHTREEVLRPNDVFDLLRAQLFGGFDDAERAGYELGEVIDQGVRPPGVHAHLPVPDAPCPAGWWQALQFDPPDYVGGTPVEPGELAPGGSWARDVVARWWVVGAAPTLESLAPLTSANATARRELVGRLFQEAITASRARDDRPRTTASVEPTNPVDIVSDEWAKLPLRFVEGAYRSGPNKNRPYLKVYNATEAEADFSKSPSAFEIAKYLANQPDSTPHRSRLCAPKEIVDGAKIAKTRDLVKSADEALVRPHLTLIRKQLKNLGWEIPRAVPDGPHKGKYELRQSSAPAGGDEPGEGGADYLPLNPD